MKVNGNERAVPAEGTVLALLKELGHDPQRVAVEKNGTIIPRAQFAEGEADRCRPSGSRMLRGRRLIPFTPNHSLVRRGHTA